MFLSVLFFILFSFSQKWKNHGKPKQFHCWVDIDLRQAFFKIFRTLVSVQDSYACINLSSRPIWYCTSSPVVRQCFNFVSTKDWYRPCCLEHFLKSEKSWTLPVFWSMSNQQRTISAFNAHMDILPRCFLLFHCYLEFVKVEYFFVFSWEWDPFANSKFQTLQITLKKFEKFAWVISPA